MAHISENKIWRIAARIDDEIIIKQAVSIEKATRMVRNAVCQRLCVSAGIEYELGWWKGRRHEGRRSFVDNFIGSPLYVLIDEEFDEELHEMLSTYMASIKISAKIAGLGLKAKNLSKKA